MSLPVFAGISLAFAPLKQNEVAQSLAAGEDSVTDVVGGSADPVALPSTDAPVATTLAGEPLDRRTVPSTRRRPRCRSTPAATTVPVDPAATTVPVDLGDSVGPRRPPLVRRRWSRPRSPTPPTTPDDIDVLAIGDSVMLGAAPALQARARSSTPR